MKYITQLRWQPFFLTRTLNALPKTIHHILQSRSHIFWQRTESRNQDIIIVTIAWLNWFTWHSQSLVQCPLYPEPKIDIQLWLCKMSLNIFLLALLLVRKFWSFWELFLFASSSLSLFFLSWYKARRYVVYGKREAFFLAVNCSWMCRKRQVWL